MSSQKVPAWKRLGLKLKQPASGAEIGGPATAEGSKPNGLQHHDRDANGPVNAANASAAAAKRKRPEHSTPPAFSSPLKKTRTDDSSNATPTLRKQKSVTFADDTKQPAAAEPTKNKKNKKAKPATQQPRADIKPSLEYLRNWKSSRETWKFNKNCQSILMKRVFLPDSIPSTDINTFYDYIQDLKGFTRQRLRETAAEVKKEDSEKGKAAFPEGTPDMDSKQSEYEKVLIGLMQLGSGASSSTTKRKRFDETGFVAQSSDVAITQRVIKRMRAETILDELEDSDDSDAMTIDTEETAATSQAAAQEEAVDKRVKLNDGTKQNAPRRRKMRTANMDDTSSDESSDDDSDDDSSSDSDLSSDDSDNESEVQRQAAQRDAADTSSSSSSSSEGEDDSSDEDSSDEEEENTKRPAGKRS